MHLDPPIIGLYARWGSLQIQRPQILELDFKGPTSKGKKGNGREGNGRKNKGERMVEEVGEEFGSPKSFVVVPCMAW